MKTIVLFSALVLVGCGGESFTTGFGPSITDTTDSAVDAGASTGGAGREETDFGTDNGGSPGAGGASSGGASMKGTGGAVTVGGTTSGSGGGAGATGDACVLVVHENGLDQVWQDCTPIGTYNFIQATRACLTSGAAQCVNMPDRCGFGVGAVRGFDKPGNNIGSWGYEGLIAGVFDPTDYWNLCAGLDAALGGAGNRPWR